MAPISSDDAHGGIEQRNSAYILRLPKELIWQIAEKLKGRRYNADEGLDGQCYSICYLCGMDTWKAKRDNDYKFAFAPHLHECNGWRGGLRELKILRSTCKQMCLAVLPLLLPFMQHVKIAKEPDLMTSTVVMTSMCHSLLMSNPAANTTGYSIKSLEFDLAWVNWTGPLHMPLVRAFAHIIPRLPQLRRLVFRPNPSLAEGETVLAIRDVIVNIWGPARRFDVAELAVGIGALYIIKHCPLVVKITRVVCEEVRSDDAEVHRMIREVSSCRKLQHFEMEAVWCTALLRRVANELSHVSTLGLIGVVSPEALDGSLGRCLKTFKSLHTLILPPFVETDAWNMYEDADRLAAAFYECDQFALAGHRHYLVSGGHAMVSLVMCSANGHSWAKPCDVVDDSYLQNSVEELETHGTLRPIFNKVYKLFANQVFALVPTVRFIWISHRDTIRGLHRAHQGDVRLTPGNPVPERGLTRERITRSPADTLLPRLSAYESCVEAESGLSDEKATSQYFAPPPNGVAW